LSRFERLLLGFAAALALALRAVALLRYRFDSDEQQHLHVAWAWTAGKVQYRDVFDNHAPLFHMLTAPVLALFGERPDILIWMRLPMLILFGVVLWATFDIGRRLYDARVAAWAAVLLALFPPFFLKSLEYRPDNLWSALWLLALAVIVRGGRPFVAGLLLGCASAASAKTAVLLIALLGASVLMRLFLKVPWNRRWIEAALGFAVVPGALAIYFAAAGATDELFYCLVNFNGSAAAMSEHLWLRRALFPLTSAALLYLAWRRGGHEHRWRWFVAVTMGVFTVVLAGFWPLVSPRDFLPVMPIAAIFAAAVLTQARHALAALATVIVVLTGALYYYGDRFENRTDWHVTMMNQALRLTRPGERLIDYKGETIYRERPFYHALEIVTRSLMARGVIADTLAQDVVRTRTYVAQADGPMWPPASRAWLSAHFVNLGRLRAAGNWVKDGTFVIGVPGEYVVLDTEGEARGLLDGTPYTGPRVLAAGPHTFTGPKEACVLWAPAWRRGHSPFHLRDLEF
jgi:hypothetical protein